MWSFLSGDWYQRILFWALLRLVGSRRRSGCRNSNPRKNPWKIRENPLNLPQESRSLVLWSFPLRFGELRGFHPFILQRLPGGYELWVPKVITTITKTSTTTYTKTSTTSSTATSTSTTSMTRHLADLWLRTLEQTTIFPNCRRCEVEDLVGCDWKSLFFFEKTFHIWAKKGIRWRRYHDLCKQHNNNDWRKSNPQRDQWHRHVAIGQSFKMWVGQILYIIILYQKTYHYIQ